MQKFRKILSICLSAALLLSCMATGLMAIADDAAVASVEAAITALSDSAIGAYSRESIEAARAAYEAMSDEDKALVSNVDTLEAAELAFDGINRLSFLDDTLNLTGGTEMYFGDVTLEENATYIYEFDMAFPSGAGATFPFLILRDGGHYLNVGAYGCIRVCNGLSFDANWLGNAAMPAATGDTQRFQIIMQPTGVKVIIDGTPVNFGDNVTGAGYPDCVVPLESVANGKLGVTGGNPGFPYTMSNISLVKVGDVGVMPTNPQVYAVEATIDAIGEVDAYSRESIEAARAAYEALSDGNKAKVSNVDTLEAAEIAFESINRLSSLNDTISLTGGTTMYFGDVTLEENATYVYEFDMAFPSGAGATFPFLILRDGGHYLNVGAYGCIRVCNGLSFDANWLGNAAMPAATGATQRFQIIMQPTGVKVIIDGTPVNFGDNVTGAGYPDCVVPLESVANGKLGVTGGNTGFPYTISNISLVKVGDVGVPPADPKAYAVEKAIEAIGVVNAYSREAIEAARAAYDALPSESKALVTNAEALTEAEAGFASINRLASFADTLTASAGETKLFDGLTLESDATYVYEFDLTVDGNLPWNQSYPWLVLRGAQTSGTFTTGQYWNMGAYGQFRFSTTTNFDAFTARGTNVDATTLTNTHSFKIIMNPTYIEAYMDGALILWDPTSWSVGAVENGLLGIIGGANASSSLSNFSLVKVGDQFCSHTWTDATCIAPKTCSVCGETEGEPTYEHIYANGVCTGCAATEAAEVSTFFGYAASVDKTALRFGFTMPVAGVVKGDAYAADLTNATITLGGVTYSVKEMGGIITNKADATLTFDGVDDSRVLKIPAAKVLEATESEASFAIGIKGIPEEYRSREISCRTYLTYQDGDHTVTIYSDIVTHSVQDYITAAGE